MGGYQCSVLTKIDVNECHSSWKKNKSWQTDLLDSLVSGVITVSPWLPTAHNNTRAWGRQGTRRERGGERLLMSVKRRNGGSGAAAACVCLEKEIRIQDPRFCGRSETIIGRDLTKKALFRIQSWWGRYRPQDHSVKLKCITLGCLVSLVSTVTTWVQWWALWPCKPSRGDRPEVRLQ